MKRIIVACGSGVATSETVAAKLRRLLEQKGVQEVEVEAININILEKQIKHADIYVAITPFKQENFPIPVFSGMAFLTGFGQEAELKKIIEEINK
ncbi:MAG: PTS sugar transporter subunit IIB [Erysipelotrichaceae bacterium]|jgi:PTS system galactitol-specific IIB component|nr:PTS sugar transporter subunit IIB [Erysipelotrichaceae bacterium]MBR2825935.1 PTS sugar transporter subunit IIB [Erysipelotrichaceae bacterium]